MRKFTMIGASVAMVLAGAAAAQTSSPTPQTPVPKPPMTTAAKPVAPAAAQPAPSGTFMTMQGQSDKLSSDLIGMPVVNGSGETIGKISALILDQSDKVTGAIITIGGFLGMGSKSVALPWQSVKVETKDRKQVAVVTMSSEQFSLAPDYKTLAQLRNEQEAQAQRALQLQQQQERQSRPAQSPAGQSPTTPAPKPAQ